MRFLILSFFLSAMFAANLSHAEYDGDVVVKTKQGYVEGVDMGRYVVFKGIPYAQAPVGNLRWKAPQPPKKFSHLLKADKFGPMSLQIAPSLSGISGGTRVIGKEDCLYLNVWVPKSAVGQNLPVMFWIHGGAYILGAGAQEIGPINIYDGAKLAQEGRVIVVTHNYRLGAMGFFAHRDLAKETKTNSTGNYGILDHIAALKWVKNNISNFGGDPKSVTIFGESAGGASVFALIATKLAKGLFSKAIAQSGAFLHNDKKEHYELGDHFVDKMQEEGVIQLRSNSNKINALRKVPGEDLVRNFQMSEMPRAHDDPIIRYGYMMDDGHVFKGTVLEIIERGDHNKVPAIIGSNKDEMLLLAPAFLKNIDDSSTDEDIKKMIAEFFDEDTAKKVLKKFNTETYGTAKEALMEFMNDALFHAPAKQVADAMERHNPGSVYKYVYSKELPKVKAGHATELPYVFGTEKMLSLLTFPYKGLLVPFFGPSIIKGKLYLEKTFGRMMRKYWTRFAWNGTPNDVVKTFGEVTWPEYRSGKFMELKEDPEVKSSFRKGTVNFVERVTRPIYVRPPICSRFFAW